MMPPLKIRHEFVEFVPKELEEGVLYVSIPYATAVHSCFCGCGTKVVTPISPVHWQLAFDGETVSLSPSVGNWAFKCRSHYFVRRDAVLWAGDMSEDEIARGRSRDRSAREAHFNGTTATSAEHAASLQKSSKKNGFCAWFLRRR